jgi:hypothetical protein
MSPPLQVAYTNEGLEAIIFTADGDMRQALNNLQVRPPCQHEPVLPTADPAGAQGAARVYVACRVATAFKR